MSSDGPSTHFYENGDLACEEEREGGVLRRRVFHRPTGATAVPHPFGQLAESVVRFELRLDREGWTTEQRVFDAEGRELTPGGHVAPPRAPGIPEDAFPSRIGTAFVWERGRFQIRGNGLVGEGLYVTWNEDGSIRSVRLWSNGACIAYVDTAPASPQRAGSKHPLIEAAKLGLVEVVEECFRLGIHGSAHAELHASLEGLPELSLRIASAPRGTFVDPRTDRERSARVPEDAVWIPGAESFVRGERDPASGRALGTWHAWRTPYGYTFVAKEERDFEEGRLVRHEQPMRDERRRATFYRDGVVVEERVVGEDGTVLETKKHEGSGVVVETRHGKVVFERIRHEGKVRASRWLDPETGRVLAEAKPADTGDLFVAHAYDDAGNVVVRGAIDGEWGEPEGTWEVLEGGAVVDRFDWANVVHRGLRLDPPRIARLARALAAWSRAEPAAEIAPLLPALADTSGFRGASGAQVARMLVGLGTSSDELFEELVSTLEGELVDCGAVCDAAGPGLAAMMDLALREGNAARQAKLLAVLASAVDEAGIHFANVDVGDGRDLAAHLLARGEAFRALAESGTTAEVAKAATRLAEGIAPERP